MNTAILSTMPTPEPEVRIMDVTPALAQEWLGLNTSNRKLKQHAVTAYAQDMKSGRWVLNGEAIKFAGPAKNPTKLLDGQNRLHAILKAKTTVQMLVIFDLEESDQITMDSGAKRTVADNLQITGVGNAVIIAASASIALHVQANRIAGGARFTNATIQAFIDENPELGVSASVAAKYARRTDVPPAVVAYTHWVFSHLDLDEATAFWRDASEKTGLSFGDPVLTLTNFFAEARRNRRNIPRAAQLSLIYRAWNARRKGQSLRVLKMNSSRGGLIDIPEPK